MKKQNYSWIILLLILTFWGCKDNSTSPTQEIEEASAQNQFVWNAMNYWYYWQGSVPELADDRQNDEEAFQSYLKGFSDAEALFNSLQYEADDFSFFIDDYEEFGQSQQGISKSFGYQFGLVRIRQGEPEILGYVQYVLSGSPAEGAGLVRGDIFTSVDGTTLTVDNYQELLQGKTSYELSLATIENDDISETGQTVSMEAVTLTESPIFESKVIDTSSTKVGYLMYNAFQTSSHEELNNAIGELQSEGINELVLDLRYNGGGSGITSQMLGGMISGLDSSNVFSRYDYNSKRSNYNRAVNFLEEVPVYGDNGQQTATISMNKLNLDRVYVLTGFGTASASEVLINALEPYIQVVLIGDQTVGKDEGSYTLYDTPVPPYLDEENANPDHKIAIQPICIKVVNKNGRDYPDGFTPDHEVIEIEYLDEGLPPIGDPNEQLLAKALELITGQPMARQKVSSGNFRVGEMVMSSQGMQQYPQGLYLDEWVQK